VITLWFSIVVLAWVLFFVLEGFDFGVGLLGPLLGRDDHERGAVVRTIGPFWDGNEVWLLATGGALFPSIQYVVSVAHGYKYAFCIEISLFSAGSLFSWYLNLVPAARR